MLESCTKENKRYQTLRINKRLLGMLAMLHLSQPKKSISKQLQDRHLIYRKEVSTLANVTLSPMSQDITGAMLQPRFIETKFNSIRMLNKEENPQACLTHRTNRKGSQTRCFKMKSRGSSMSNNKMTRGHLNHSSYIRFRRTKYFSPI